MKALQILNLNLFAIGVVLVTCTGGFYLATANAAPPAGGTEPPPFQDQLDLLNKRVDRLYRMPEPGELSDIRGDLFETENGKMLWEFTGWQHLDYQNLMAAPSGEWVAIFKILKKRGIYLLDARTGMITGKLATEEGQGLSVAVSPDNRQVAVGTPGVYLWDAKRREVVRHLKGHQNWVVTLAFSADGRRLASGSGDSTARVWDVESGVELGRIRFLGSDTYVHSVGFSCDGRLVLAAAAGGQLILARTPLVAGKP